MKKKTLLLTLASSTLLLSSCGKVVAQFPDGDSALTNATIQLDHNTLNVIYDSIKKGLTKECLNLQLEERCRYGFPITKEEKEKLQREHIILSRKLLNS